MRIRIIEKPTRTRIDGIRLDHFLPGLLYEVGNTLGAYMLAEGWAEPVPSDEPAMLVPMSEFEPDMNAAMAPNLRREIYPPYSDGPLALAMDRRTRPRRRR